MKKTPWIILIVIFGVLNLALASVILISPTRQQIDELRNIFSELEEGETTKASEKETKKDTKKDTKKEEETKKTEQDTEEPTKEEIIVKDWNVSDPVQGDFSWVDDIPAFQDQSTEITDVLAQCGAWKCQVWYYDSSGAFLGTEIIAADLDLTNGYVTFAPIQILFSGDMEWTDETGDPVWFYKGDFGQYGSWSGTGEFGSLTLGSFWQYQGSQYGKADMAIDGGNTGEVFFVRP